MLTKVEVRTDKGTMLTLSLTDFSNGYLVKNIDGLDPVKATMVSSSFASIEGEQYQSSRREKRNITIKLGFEPNYGVTSVRTLRNNLYPFFMPKSNVSLRFYMDDYHPVDIVGKVESLETALFSKDPEIAISILCFNSDFYDPSTISLSGNTTNSGVLTDINYDGSLETGINFTLNVNRSLGEFSIYNSPPDNSTSLLSFVGALVSGDVIKINTTPGSKSVTLNRGTSTTSMLYAISPQSNWIQLYPGNNTFRVNATGAPIPYIIEYTSKYGGL